MHAQENMKVFMLLFIFLVPINFVNDYVVVSVLYLTVLVYQ